MVQDVDIPGSLAQRFGPDAFVAQATADAIPTLWVGADHLRDVLRHLKTAHQPAFDMLFDLTAIDERERTCRQGQPPSDFTVVYHLLSTASGQELRLKVARTGQAGVPSVCDLWPCANWYERELWDMFGIDVSGHPGLTRILMPPWWQGHPLRKEHFSRATEGPPLDMDAARGEQWLEMLRFRPEDHGLPPADQDRQHMYLNVGPHHPGTHGLLRVVLRLQGQEIRDSFCEIGFHHRGAEKMGERQTWHTFIPYTDRVDYLAGVLNNFPYVLAVEKLAGIEVPDRAKVIRVMTAELYRIISHLVYFGTFAQDVGMMSPVFYAFADRERALDIAEAITGGRMHPGWFRIGGVAQDLPSGWQGMVQEFLSYLPAQLREYERMVLGNRIFRARTRGVGVISVRDAVEWGATGPVLRAAGLAWDWRKLRPYGGYEQFEFDIPSGTRGDCYDRAVQHVQEMRQSLRIIRQCLDNMPPGAVKANHPLATPPPRPRMLEDIETLIQHFLQVSWGTVIPPGEAAGRIESAKGLTSYYLVSDGGTTSYRTRIRTPSFPHVQLLPRLIRGGSVPDLATVLGSLDFVLADVDR